MNINTIKQGAEQFLSENASTILTVSGVVGTVSTAALSVRAGYRSCVILTEAKLERKIGERDDVEVVEETKLSKFEKTRLVAPQFVPPVVVGGVTVASIIMANRINAQRAAALIAAYGLADKRLEEYKTKVHEKLTGPKAQAIEDEIAQDRVNENPPGKEIVIVGSGDVLFMDMITGRYFNSTVEKVKTAIAQINHQLFEEQSASLSDFYNLIDVRPTGYTDMIGWNGLNGGVLELRLSTTTTDDNRPCMTIDFSRAPMPGFTKTWMD